MNLFSLVRAAGTGFASIVAASALPWTGHGPVAFRVTLPSIAASEFEPLLSVGAPGKGEVIFFRRLPDDRVCFGWERANAGAILSDPVAIGGKNPHEILISLGSLLTNEGSADELAPLREVVLVQFDGKPALVTKGNVSVASEGKAVLGKNIVGGSMAGASFSGRIENATLLEPRMALAAATGSQSVLMSEGDAMHVGEPEYPGPVRIRLRFPPNLTGRNEPLVVTGITGKGDFIFVRYQDSQHVKIGLDHWLVGGPVTEPLACDYSIPHELIISLGSLLPPPDPKKPDSPAVAMLRTHALVQLDGKTVIACESAFYPTAAGQISLGANRIGGSTSEPLFYGQVLGAERIAPEIAAAALR